MSGASVSIRRGGTWMRVPGERVAPGLAIADRRGVPGARQDVPWAITHTRTGLPVAFACCESGAREVAALLAGIADWTLFGRQLRDDHERIIREARRRGVYLSLGYDCRACESLR